MKLGGWIKGLIALALVLVGLRWATRTPELEAIDVVSAKARMATVVRKIRATGHVEPVTKVRVSASISGDLLALHVKEGDVVVRGQPLAEIDKARLAAVLRQAEASARSASAAVNVENAQLDQAESELARAGEMHKKGLSTDAELDRMRSRVDITKARLDGAKQRVEQARASLDEAKARLQQTRIAAPIDGSVIRLWKKVGERIRGSDLAEDILATIAPLHAMEVEVQVSEQEVVNLEVGQIAEIEIDALGERTIPGRVVEIASAATVRFRGEEREVTSFTVTVGLDRIPERLRSGMSASVAIVTATHEDVVAVPIEAVTARLPSKLKVRAEELLAKRKEKRIWDRDSDDKPPEAVRRREKPVRIVFTIANGFVEPQRIETGISSDTSIEVLSGLKANDEVVAGPYRVISRELAGGSKVKVVDTIEVEPDPTPPKEVAAESGQ